MPGRVRVLAAAAAIAALAWVAAPVSAVSLEPGKTLVEHFNGSKWVKLTSPSPPGGDALFDVDVLSASDGWAVGVHGKEQRAHPLIEQWDGSKWTVKRAGDSVEFSQTVNDPSSGYGYQYTKVVRLTKGKPVERYFR